MPDNVPLAGTVTVRWHPERASLPPPWRVQKLGVALLRGLRGRCPACGRTRLFRGFLRVVPACANCNAPLGRVRADDAPPYFTIVLVGHLVIPLTFIADRTWQPPLWAETTVGAAAMLGLALVLMRPVKGATVGLMLWLGLIEAEAATPDTDAVRGA